MRNQGAKKVRSEVDQQNKNRTLGWEGAGKAFWFDKTKTRET